MQVKHEMDYEYRATTCVGEIEGWCLLNLFLYYTMEPFRTPSTF